MSTDIYTFNEEELTNLSLHLVRFNGYLIQNKKKYSRLIRRLKQWTKKEQLSNRSSKHTCMSNDKYLFTWEYQQYYNEYQGILKAFNNGHTEIDNNIDKI